MKSFLDNMMQGEIRDVLISGYIDVDPLPIFHPIYDRIYFVISDTIFELYIDDGVILYNELESIKAWFDIDPDDGFSLMSLYSQLFKTESEIKVKSVDYSSIPFSPITIHYIEGENNRKLHIEPENFFGFPFL